MLDPFVRVIQRADISQFTHHPRDSSEMFMQQKHCSVVYMFYLQILVHHADINFRIDCRQVVHMLLSCDHYVVHVFRRKTHRDNLNRLNRSIQLVELYLIQVKHDPGNLDWPGMSSAF